MTILAPAKINLSLRVLRRRDDGFHDIESLIVPVSIFDRLEIDRREAGGIAFTCNEPEVPADNTNLVVRAAISFCATFGIPPNLRIVLHKEIPHGAGLGGGSSDAAATLLALDEILATNAPCETLHRLGADIGSDVPFFLDRSAARVDGRGDHVTPCAFPHTLPLLLIKPPFGVPTPWAYRQWRDSLEIPGVRYAAQEFAWGSLVNDLERPVFEKYVFLADLKRWLLAQPEVGGALMSGSGATVFAVLREKTCVEPLRARVAKEFGDGLWVRFAETLAPTMQ
ncbi:MAG: 4-(cytidine 5'-diphospho)-2-C-methyl-D-erythritol kinase [Chthoniobacteraceae bacterium]